MIENNLFSESELIFSDALKKVLSLFGNSVNEEIIDALNIARIHEQDFFRNYKLVDKILNQIFGSSVANIILEATKEEIQLVINANYSESLEKVLERIQLKNHF